MHKIWFLIKNNIFSWLFPSILVILCLVISYKNYTPGTWQTGWDTLHPEFNFKINFPRHLFGMWQENQGLGSVGGHAHAADTSRIVVMYLMSFFLPTHVLRYAYLYLTLIFGPLGMYFFLKDIVFVYTKSNKIRCLLSFVGACFYIFNLGTVQQYIVQLEMYTVLYAVLPWYFLFSIKYLKNGNKRDLFNLFIAGILGAPHAYSITVFIGLFSTLSLFLFISSFTDLFNLSRRTTIKRSIFISVFIILINSYWLFPNLYFGIKHSDFVPISNINAQFSNNIFLHNVKHGTPLDLLENKGFLMEWENYDFNFKTFRPIMLSWNHYSESNKDIKYIGLAVVGVIILGLFYLFFYNNKLATSIYAVFLFCSFMFLTINPPFGSVFGLFKEHFSILGEMLRNPYTKFSIELIFIYSVFFALGVSLITKVMRKLIQNSFKTQLLVCFFFTFLIMYQMYPMFRGSLIHKDIRLKIPDEYFQLFNYMNKQPDTRRVAFLPIHSQWGWEYYNWGYQGAGFIWFGLKQPVLSRDFDRWNKYNEEYYYEMTKAIYSKNLDALEAVVKKYGIGFIVLDENVVSTESNTSITFVPETKELLSKSVFIRETATFGGIHVYKVSDGRTNPFYVVKNGENNIIDYPFTYGRKFVSGEGQRILKGNGEYVLESVSQNNVFGSVLKLDEIWEKERFLPTAIYAKRLNNSIYLKIKYLIPDIYVNDKKVIVASDYYTELSVPSNDFDNLAFSFDDKILPYFGTIAQEYTLIGTTLLSTKADTFVQVFALKQESKQTNLIKDTFSLWKSCSTGTDAYIYYKSDHISLLSGEDESCIKHELFSEAIQYPSLLKVDISYQSELGDSLNYCIGNDSECVNNLGYSPNKAIDSYKSFTDFVFVDKQAYIKLFSPVDPTKHVSKGTFDSVTIQTYLPVGTTVLSVDAKMRDTRLKTNKIVLDSGSLIIKAIFSNLIPNKYLTQQTLYEASTALDVSEGLNTKMLEDGINYRSEDGTFFDSVLFPKLSNASSYIVEVQNENISGNNLNVSVTSDLIADKKIIDKSLFEGTLFTIPALTEENSTYGYKVGIVNSSPGRTTSENVLKYISFYPYIGNWVSSISIASSLSETQSEKYWDKRFKVTKLVPFLYKISGLTKSDKLVYETSFESGWIAIGGSNHSKADGWANSWQINNSNVYIVFLPEIIQIFGYVIVVVIFIYFTGKNCLKSRPNKFDINPIV